MLSYVSRVALPSPAVAHIFTAFRSSFFWDGGTEIVDRALLRLSRSRDDWSMPCVNRTSQILAQRAVLRDLVDIDRRARWSLPSPSSPRPRPSGVWEFLSKRLNHASPLRVCVRYFPAAHDVAYTERYPAFSPGPRG